MEELEKIRLQTEAARTQTSKSASQKKAALEARLKKVRDLKRLRMGLKPLSRFLYPILLLFSLSSVTFVIRFDFFFF